MRRSLVLAAVFGLLALAGCGNSAFTADVSNGGSVLEGSQPPAPGGDAAETPEEGLADPDGDGRPTDQDDYPHDASRWTTRDRDGDGVPNGADVAPDDPTRSAWDRGVVTSVVDGDTVDVAGYGRIRVIGVDTPERGECGYDWASRVMADLVLGRTVTLVPGARDDVDRYGRLLRYLDVGGSDAGLRLIQRGLAVARYDSRDGYGRHAREDRYVRADANSPDRSQAFCSAPPLFATEPAPGGGAEPWNLPGPDLDCSDIGRKVWISGPDYHWLDADGDGWGCDSYA